MKSEFLETIKISDTKPMYLDFHQKRYESVLKHFGVDRFKNLADHIKAPDSKLYRCRVIFTPDDIDDIKVEYIEYEKRDIKSLKLVHDNNIEYPLKSTNRAELNSLFEKRQNADDILIVKNGYITDTSIANVAFFDGMWKTPSSPLLKGTTRDRFLHSEMLVEADIKVSDLKKFSKVALLNAMVDFDIIADGNIKDLFC